MIRAYAPASIGNVAAGFDILGAALAPIDGSLLGDVVRVELDVQTSFLTEGAYATRLPRDPSQNLVMVVHRLFSQRRPLPRLRIVLEKHLPLNSGLGSSSASIVAALVAFEAVAGRLDDTCRLALVGQAEGEFSGAPHLDNVAPALLGGLRLVGVIRGTPHLLPWPSDRVFVVVHPDLELSTAASRAALPRAIAIPDAVGFAANLASLIHALHTGDDALLAASLRDPLAEPHRGPLVRGFSEVQAAARAAGALGGSLSGSGPAVFAVAPKEQAHRVSAAMTLAFGEAGVAARSWICGLDAGARVLA